MCRPLHRLAAVLVASGLLLGGWLLVDPGSAASGTQTFRYVAPDGNCATNTPCYAHPQAAVDAASDGDRILVATGRYIGVSSRNGAAQLVYLDKSITLQGGYHPQTWAPDPAQAPTILDAEGQGRVLTIAGQASPVIDGFHLVNGVAGNGGAVYVDTATAALSHNQIYGNWAEGFGGGVYLKSSAATVRGNHIYTNTTGPSGHGGGVALDNSPATVEDNLIEENRAHVGGGVSMSNYLGEGGALLAGNTIRNNIAFDRQEDIHTFAGAGGGIDLRSSLTDTLRSNVISGNSAKWGGGIHAFGAAAALVGNTIQRNDAAIHGGGLYVQGGRLILEGNDILSNTAASWGGGLTLLANDASVRRNTFQGNASASRGGGMYTEGASQFDGNLFLDNVAAEYGGGVFSVRTSSPFFQGAALYQNNVMVRNHADKGGAFYIWAANARLLHTTIVGNTSGDGRAVVIDKYTTPVSPSALFTASVAFTNTIVAGQPVGFFATPDNRLTLDGVLWWQTPTRIQAAGAALTVLNEHEGDPMFQADGYHIRLYSAAQDKGKGDLDHDVDGHLRDWGDAKDLGADEHVPAVVVSPEAGGRLAYADPQEEVTITVTVPPDAVTEKVTIMFSPFPPPPPDVLDSPFGKFIPFGPPFRLDSFEIDVPVADPADPPIEDHSDIADAVIFERYPAHIVAEIGVERLKGYYKSMERLELQLMALLDQPSPPRVPACGPVQRDLEAHMLDVPICDTGIVSGTLMAAAGSPLHLMQVEAGPGTGYFMLLLEVEDQMIYLPLIRR